jgi:hypothetical protein
MRFAYYIEAMKGPKNIIDYVLKNKGGQSKNRAYNPPKSKARKKRRQARKSRKNNR